MNIPSAVGGLAGAFALTALNETVKRVDKDAPRLDLLGMNAMAKIVKGAGLKNYLSGQHKLMPVSLAGDLISNTLYFGMAEAGSKNKTLARGAILGLGAGIGAIALAKPLGLDDHFSNTSVKTKVLTVAWYVVGGLVAAAVINLLAKKQSA